METKTSLRAVLKRLRLSGIVATLPDRSAYARKAKLDPLDFLELVLQDEIDRRERNTLATRIRNAGVDPDQTFETFDWDAPLTFDRHAVRDLFGLGFLDRHDDILLLGPVGVGKTFLACALGHAVCRAGRRVLMLRADALFRELRQSRADNSYEKALRRFLAPDLLIVDDFGLKRLDAMQSSDLHELIIARHRRASTCVTSNRTPDEWIALFDDPILAQSALDRLVHAAHHVVIEGDSYRKRLAPGRNDGAATPRPKGRKART